MERQYYKIASYDAKTKFAELIDQVDKENKHFIITRYGKEIARIEPFEEEQDSDKLKCRIDEFLRYRKERKLDLTRGNGENLKDLIHNEHRY